MIRMAIGSFLAALILVGCSATGEEDDRPVQEEANLAVSSELSSVASSSDKEERSANGRLSPDDAGTVAAGVPPGRIVDCLVVTHGDHYDGPCRFLADGDGSFSLSLDDESPIVDAITLVSVTILEPGHSEVRGLTIDGINSRWGSAIRDAEDRACWNGPDFTICAY